MQSLNEGELKQNPDRWGQLKFLPDSDINIDKEAAIIILVLDVKATESIKFNNSAGNEEETLHLDSYHLFSLWLI